MNLRDLTAAIAGLSEAHRPIRLRLWRHDGVLDDVLLVQRVSRGETASTVGHTIRAIGLQVDRKFVP